MQWRHLRRPKVARSLALSITPYVPPFEPAERPPDPSSTIRNGDHTRRAFTLHQMYLQVIPSAQSLARLHALAQELLEKNSLEEDDLEDSINDFD